MNWGGGGVTVCNLVRLNSCSSRLILLWVSVLSVGIITSSRRSLVKHMKRRPTKFLKFFWMWPWFNRLRCRFDVGICEITESDYYLKYENFPLIIKGKKHCLLTCLSLGQPFFFFLRSLINFIMSCWWIFRLSEDFASLNEDHGGGKTLVIADTFRIYPSGKETNQPRNCD